MKIKSVKYVELSDILTPPAYEFFTEKQKSLDIGNADFTLFSPIDIANQIEKLDNWTGLGYSGDNHSVRHALRQRVLAVSEDVFIKV